MKDSESLHPQAKVGSRKTVNARNSEVGNGILRDGVHSRHRVLLAVALLVSLTAVISQVVPTWSQKPQYNGRPYDYWLGRLPSTWVAADGQHLRAHPYTVLFQGNPARSDEAKWWNEAEEAVQAVKMFGTNCLPDFIVRLQSKDTLFEKTFRGCLFKLRIAKSTGISPADVRRGQALTAIAELGKRAKPILPDLLALTNHQDARMRTLALEAVRCVAPDEYEKHRSPQKTPR